MSQPRATTAAPRLTIRAARETDVAPLGFFFDTLLRQDYFLRRGQLADMIRDRSHRVLIAEIEDVLVGVAILTAGARLVNALVHPAYRALGVGRAIVEASGAKEVRAKLDMSTGDPRPFYRRLGFRATGRRNDKGNIEVMRKPARTAATRKPQPAQPQPTIQQGVAT